jgi:N-acetylmuramoyl-L-alanine amidase
MDKQSFYVIRAFQQHFRPWKSDGVADIGTAATLWSLLEKYFPKSLDKDMKIICPND